MILFIVEFGNLIGLTEFKFISTFLEVLVLDYSDIFMQNVTTNIPLLFLQMYACLQYEWVELISQNAVLYFRNEHCKRGSRIIMFIKLKKKKVIQIRKIRWNATPMYARIWLVSVECSFFFSLKINQL